MHIHFKSLAYVFGQTASAVTTVFPQKGSEIII